MNPQERELITDLFRRLREADTAPKDQEADELIRRLASEHAGATYLLTQTVIVQEHALTAAQGRIEELQRQVAAASRPAEPSSFLGGLFGGGGSGRRQAAPPPPPPPPQAGPWGAQPYQQPGPWGAPQPSGGGFMQSALTTAVGVAGGALLFEGVSHMFGGGTANAATFGSMAPPVVENTTINNYYGDQNDDGDAYDSSSDGGSFFDDV